MNKPEMVFPIAHIHYEDEIDESGKVVVPDEVLDAIKTLIRWTGDDPRREGLLDTPKRVAQAYREWFCGYDDDPVELLAELPEAARVAG